MRHQPWEKLRCEQTWRLMARLMHTEHTLLDTRLQIFAAPKAAPLVGTGTIGTNMHW